MMKANRLFPAVQSLWRRARTLSRRSSGLLPEPAAQGQTTVQALCTCVLGDGSASAASAWPPRSISELTQLIDRRPGATIFGTPTVELESLLEQGLVALDEAARVETGCSFARIERPAQLRALFRLESGHLALPRRRAAFFVDAFLALAAQAYLCDALAATPPGRGRRDEPRPASRANLRGGAHPHLAIAESD
jgi:hypothetical protein